MKKLFVLFSLFAFVTCPAVEPSLHAQKWGELPQSSYPVDVLYFCSTNVISSRDSLGREVFNAVLDSTERAAFRKEISYAHKVFFPDSLNFYAPYYHQATMNGLLDSGALEYLEQAFSELQRDFDYYMQHYNGGRPFILAGFSQGGMMALELVKHMSDEQYSHLVAAYLMGCGLNESDLADGHVIAAKGALDIGVCVSFNTVSDTCGIWPLAYRDAVTCINPVNWKTDSTPAEFFFPGRGKIPAQNLTVRVDPRKNVLVVPEFVSEANPYWPAQCLHHFDILFYSDYIRRNALDRAYP